MNKRCAWCGADLGAVPSSRDADSRITHAICTSCRDEMTSQIGIPLDEFLASLGAPVVLLGSDLRAIASNEAAREMSSGEPAPIEGRLPGEVFECATARLPGGCGHTIHCSGCVIRKTVTATLRTGAPARRVPATLERGADREDAVIAFFISTDRMADRVLLRIEPAS